VPNQSQTTIAGDVVIFPGRVKASQLDIPAEAVGDEGFTTDPDRALDATKVYHQHQVIVKQARGTDVVARTEGVHVAYGDGEVVAVSACLQTPCVSAATVTVDLLKNGTTVLSAVITLDNSQAAYVLEPGVVSTPDYDDGDVFEVAVAITGGADVGQGLTVLIVLREAANP
jgi:hypothetical protein